MSSPPDHIGWTLWRAAQAWRGEFAAAMVAAGHPWYAQARGNLVQHIGPAGIRQGDLAPRAGLTKQAVQQFVDELVADGILARVPEKTDARARRVELTQAGRKAMQDADRIKLEIQSRWTARLGDDGFGQLDRLLRRLVDDAPASALPPPGQVAIKT